MPVMKIPCPSNSKFLDALVLAIPLVNFLNVLLLDEKYENYKKTTVCYIVSEHSPRVLLRI